MTAAGWDDLAAMKLVGAVARQHLGRFERFAGIDHDELCQRLMLDVVRAFPNFDPAKAGFSTWVTVVATRRCIDQLRQISRQAERDTAYAEARAGEVVEVIDPPEDPASEVFDGDVLGSSATQTLAEWCESVRVNARAMYGDRTCEVGDRTYPVEELAPLAMLQARLGLSASGIFWVLSQRPDLCRAVGHAEPPDRLRVGAAGELLDRLNKSKPQTLTKVTGRSQKRAPSVRAEHHA